MTLAGSTAGHQALALQFESVRNVEAWPHRCPQSSGGLVCYSSREPALRRLRAGGAASWSPSYRREGPRWSLGALLRPGLAGMPGTGFPESSARPLTTVTPALLGRGAWACGIRFRISRRRRAGWMQGGPQSRSRCPCEKKERGVRHTGTRQEQSGRPRGDIGVTWPHAPGHRGHQELEEARTDSPLGVLEAGGPCATWTRLIPGSVKQSISGSRQVVPAAPRKWPRAQQVLHDPCADGCSGFDVPQP